MCIYGDGGGDLYKEKEDEGDASETPHSAPV